jgi:hypothetical protein
VLCLGELITATQSRLVIDGESIPLARGLDLDELRAQIAAAAASGTGTLVDFMTPDGLRVSALVTPVTRLLLLTELYTSDHGSAIPECPPPTENYEY